MLYQNWQLQLRLGLLLRTYTCTVIQCMITQNLAIGGPVAANSDNALIQPEMTFFYQGMFVHSCITLSECSSFSSFSQQMLLLVHGPNQC